MSDTDSDMKPDAQAEPEKNRKTIWWYLLGRPAIPAVGLMALTIGFHNKFSPSWEIPHSDDLRSDATCYMKYNGTFERRFIMDLTYGSYTFAAAKAIDVIWNTIIGEGGRFLHAYVLYKHVARSLLVCLMEYSSVTYQDYIDITFSQSVFSGLMFLIRMFCRRNKFTVWLCLVGMLYMLLYTILFPTIWGGATGYLSPAQRTYHMPDDSYISVDSERLTLCWSIDSSRLGLPAGHVEIGPDFSQLQSWLTTPQKKGTWTGFQVLDQDNQGDTADAWHHGTGKNNPQVQLEDFFFNGWDHSLWDDIGPAGMGLGIEVSGAFQEIFAYAFTSRIFQVAFNASGLSIAGYDAEIQLPTNYQSGSIELEFYRDNITTGVISHDSLPVSLEGKNYRYVNWTQKSQDDVQYIEYFNTWPMIALPTNYILDESILPGPGIIPYNSTIVLDKNAHSLEAPFLDIGHDCSHPLNYLTALGNCVCYNGAPLANDWYRDENVVCVFSSIYIWGFSSYIVYIGLICEIVWIVIAFWIRGYCRWWSTLIKHSIAQTGVIWSVLELSEAVKRDLGGDIALSKERLLYQRLEKCDGLGYATDRDDFGNLEGVRIVSKCRREKDLETKWKSEDMECMIER